MSLPESPRVPTREKIASRASEQLDGVRRRANAYTAQQAVYESLALLFAFGTLLIAAAWWLPEVMFSATLWGLALAFGVAVTRALVSARESWLRRATAALAVDRSAGLEERLATFVALSPSSPPSRLWPRLARETEAQFPLWAPKRLIPSMVPKRALGNLCASITTAVLALVLSLGARDPTWPGVTPRASKPLRTPPSSEGTPALSGESDALSSFLSTLSSLPEDVRRAIRGTREPAGSSRDARRGSDRAARPGDAPPGAKSSDDRESGEPSTGTRRQNADPTRNGRDGKALAKAARTGNEGDDPLRVLPKVEIGRPGDRDGRKLGRGGQGKGAGIGADADGLFGAPDSSGPASRAFELSLDAEAGESRAGREDSSPASPIDAALAPDPVLDDAVLRARVPPEYEGIVRRLFSQPEASDPAE